MRIRLTKIDEYQFLTCLKHSLWGSKSARFKTWQVEDQLAIIVDKSLAALAQVAGPAFESREKVWDNGLFPHRISIKFRHVLRAEDRPPILGAIRDALIQQWGTRYGWAILNQQVLEGINADTVVQAIMSRKNALIEFQQSLAERLEEARLKRGQFAPIRRRQKQPKSTLAPEQLTSEDERVSEKDASAHTKAQSELITLGRISGCSVWVASNDKGRIYDGKALADDCLKTLPRMGLSEDTTKRISRIDVIWVKRNAPMCAFEIETSTSIYSGLLRMSDLLADVPTLNIQIYIVAPRERQNKVLAELARPTFRKIGLSEYCRYICSEDLSELTRRVKGLGGHIQPSILNTIAIPLEDDDDEENP